MLTQVCQYLKNWFELDKKFGQFEIVGGHLITDVGLLPGQYFRIIGSVFNDGVHKFDDTDILKDETFEGCIWLMAVPQAVIQLCEQIDDYGSSHEISPFSSESFGGYSYTKASSGSGESGDPGDWHFVFAKSLNPWRKI